jgi:hypothetical protein
VSKLSDDHPDVELVLGASSLAGDISGSYRGLIGLTEEFYKEVFADYLGVHAFMIVPVVLRPKSRGRLTLRTSNPSDSPIVDINYYDHEDDLNTMVRAIKMVTISLIYLTINLLALHLRVTSSLMVTFPTRSLINNLYSLLSHV